MKHKIMYFHIGNPEFVVQSIKQTHHWNPDSDIYLIGDIPPEETKDIVKFYDYQDLICQSGSNFMKNFVNLSSNNADFEKICIFRWFAIKELCRKENIEKIFYMDSDIMLYCNLEEELSKFQNTRYALSNGSSAAVFCVNDITVLEDYCRYVDGFYDDSQVNNTFTLREHTRLFGHIREDITSFYTNRTKFKLPGGVCDMTFWGELKKIDDPLMVGEISGVRERTTFDHNINAPDFFEFENGKKKISWENGQPYVYNTYLKDKIRFNSLHFQGYDSKVLMKKHCSYE